MNWNKIQTKSRTRKQIDCNEEEQFCVIVVVDERTVDDCRKLHIQNGRGYSTLVSFARRPISLSVFVDFHNLIGRHFYEKARFAFYFQRLDYSTSHIYDNCLELRATRKCGRSSSCLSLYSPPLHSALASGKRCERESSVVRNSFRIFEIIVILKFKNSHVRYFLLQLKCHHRSGPCRPSWFF